MTDLEKLCLTIIGSVHGYKELSLALPAITTLFAKNRIGYQLGVSKNSNMRKSSNI